jgi:hypothetical protein
MPTLLGVFKDRKDPDAVIEQLVGLGVDQEHIGLVWREKIVRKAEEIEVVTYVDHFDGPAIEAKKGAWGGLVGGAAFGVGSALLAGAGIILGPHVAALLGTGTAAAAAAAAAAGAAGGGLTGGAIGALLGATDHGATKKVTTEREYHDVTETDGFVVTVEAEESEGNKAAAALKNAGAADVTILGGEGTRLRTHVD